MCHAHILAGRKSPRGSGDGRLRSPHALAFDNQDHLYAADRGNTRVAVFDRDGKCFAAWTKGRIDTSDTLYVIDSQSLTIKALAGSRSTTLIDLS